jgi:hypothetical protein
MTCICNGKSTARLQKRRSFAPSPTLFIGRLVMRLPFANQGLDRLLQGRPLRAQLSRSACVRNRVHTPLFIRPTAKARSGRFDSFDAPLGNNRCLRDVVWSIDEGRGSPGRSGLTGLEQIANLGYGRSATASPPMRIACRVGKRSGSYRLARLAAKYGPEITLRDLTERFSYDCLWRAEARSKKGKSACGFTCLTLSTSGPLRRRQCRSAAGDPDSPRGRQTAPVQQLRRQHDIDPTRLAYEPTAGRS